MPGRALAITLLMLLCGYPGGAFAQPDNDDFTNATALPALSGSIHGSNIDATRETGEPDHALNEGGKSVWWVFTAENRGPVTINTNGSEFDTLLAVYKGTSPGNLTKVAESDDSFNSTRSSLNYNAKPGITYYIALDGYGGDCGAFALNYSVPSGAVPPNDDFYCATALATSAGTVFGSNVGATRQISEPDRMEPASDNSVWWRYTAEANGTVEVNTLGSNFDTVLAIYRGPYISPIDLLTQNDDDGYTYASKVSFTAYAGTTYHICVDGSYVDSTGSIVLNYNGPAGIRPGNDNFTSATVLTGTSGTVNDSNIAATIEPGEPNHSGTGGRSLWWKYTAVTDGIITANTNGSAFDTVLAVYTGSSVGALTPVAANDDTDRTASSISFTALAGTDYYIAVDGYGGASGNIILNYTGPPGNPTAISCSPSSLLMTCTYGTNAPSQALEIWNSGNNRTLSYSFAFLSSWLSVSPSSGSSAGLPQTHTLTFKTSDLLPGVHKGGLTIISPDPVVANRSVRFTLKVLYPENDDFTSATELPGVSGSITSSNMGATREQNEPYHAGSYGYKSLWWKYTPQNSGAVIIDTKGSSFDTLLAVYTGSSVDALTGIVSNNDYSGMGTSLVAFNAVAGTTYYIAVDGDGSDRGSISLNYSSSSEPLAVLSNFPFTLSTTCTAGANAPSQAFEVWNSGNSSPATYSITDNVSWLSADASSGSSAGSPQAHTVTYKTSGLLPGTHIGNITVDSPDPGVASRTIPVTVTVFGPANDNFTSATVLPGMSGTASGSNFGATTEPGEPNHWGSAAKSVWWTYTADRDGTMTINTNGSSFDTVLAVYTGSSVDAVTRVASNNNDGVGDAGLVIFAATAGRTYHIAVDGYSGQHGNITLNYYGPGEPTAALSIFPTALSTSSTAGAIAPSQSFEVWNSRTSNAVDYTISDDAFWLSVAPASGSSAGAPQAHTVTYNSSGLSSGTYTGTITISSFTAAPCTLPVSLTVSGPFNDNFSSATILSGTSGSVNGSNVGATKEPGEPEHVRWLAHKSVWWTYTSPTTGTVTIDTLGSNFDTVLAVYVGSSLNTLSLIAHDDNSGSYLTSRVSFAAGAGTIYHIAVAGDYGASGNVALNYRGPTDSDTGLSLFPVGMDVNAAHGTDAPSRFFQVWNSSDYNSLSYSIVDNVEWMSVSPSYGTVGVSANEHTIVFNTSGLSEGAYNGTIYISSAGVERTVWVRLMIGEYAAADDTWTLYR